jgi:hypothetical protein
MAGRVKREPKRRATSAALVDVNIWDLLFGLAEPAEAPAVPETDGRPAGLVPAEAGRGDRSEPAEPIRAVRRETGRKPPRETKRKGETGSKA